MLKTDNFLIPLLSSAEFAHLHLECRMLEAIHVDVATIIRLRRRLRASAQEVLRDKAGVFKELFEPHLSPDPVALKRYQKGAPAFVIDSGSIRYGEYHPGDMFKFEVRLFGSIAMHASGLIETFAALGKTGFRLDAGKYILEHVKAGDASGKAITVWHQSGGAECHNIPRLDLGWWLQDQPQKCHGFKLKFATPARLLPRGKPMFSPTISTLLPFVHRRVTSMLYTHCGVELDPAELELNPGVNGWNCVKNNLFWHDWRNLYSGAGNPHPIGGVYGDVCVQGDIAPPVLSVLQLGSLMNLGKNAAYGAGSYSIVHRMD